jgi:nicotinate-nucleotide pyrophosphorylase (carboxylating)
MRRDFAPVLADDHLQRAVERLVELGREEDLAGDGLHGDGDVTSLATVPDGTTGRCAVVAREPGVAAGLIAVPWLIESLGYDIAFTPRCGDGDRFAAGSLLATLAGNARHMLAAERLMLNLLSRLCGVATLTSGFVECVGHGGARLYDTRKTNLGWRLLEKYAVRCGGGHNHRIGLFDAVLIKDNHLALAAGTATDGDPSGGASGAAGGSDKTPLAPSEAIRRAKAWRRQRGGAAENMLIEIEVDSLDQLADALSEPPDLVLLDNFTVEQLHEAVTRRNARAPQVELEASGGVNLETVADLAATGVDRISCGAITHQATWLDLGLDWIG